MIRIAVAEDDLSWAHQLQTYVDQYARESGKSFEVSLFADGEDLLEQYHGQFDLVFLDVQMRFLDGMATAELIRRTDPEVIIIIFITNMASTPSEAMRWTRWTTCSSWWATPPLPSG